MRNREKDPRGAQGEVAARKAALRKRLRTERAALTPDERATADARIAARLFALPAWREARVVFAYLSFGSEVDTRRIIERVWAEGKTVALPRCAPAPVAGADSRATDKPAEPAAEGVPTASDPAADPNAPTPADRKMTWHRVTSFDGLVRSSLGVEEPPANPATRIEPTTCGIDAGMHELGAPNAPVNLTAPSGLASPTGPDAANSAAGNPAHAIALVPGLAFDAQGYRIGYGGGYYDAFLTAFPGVAIGLCRRTQLAESLRTQGVVEPHDIPVQIVVSG